MHVCRTKAKNSTPDSNPAKKQKREEPQEGLTRATNGDAKARLKSALATIEDILSEYEHRERVATRVADVADDDLVALVRGLGGIQTNDALKSSIGSMLKRRVGPMNSRQTIDFVAAEFANLVEGASREETTAAIASLWGTDTDSIGATLTSILKDCDDKIEEADKETRQTHDPVVLSSLTNEQC